MFLLNQDNTPGSCRIITSIIYVEVEDGECGMRGMSAMRCDSDNRESDNDTSFGDEK